MTRYALLLRGVNVGTNNSLLMAELRTMLTNLGCSDLQTYVQSGNAVRGRAVALPAGGLVASGQREDDRRWHDVSWIRSDASGLTMRPCSLAHVLTVEYF